MRPIAPLRRAACLGSVVLVSVTVGLPGLAPARAASADANPYFDAPFTARPNAAAFGQDPSWAPDGRVLSNEADAAGIDQVWVSTLGGADRHCLTCGQPGPNGFPQRRSARRASAGSGPICTSCAPTAPT
jgi:hypothetical protein